MIDLAKYIYLRDKGIVKLTFVGKSIFYTKKNFDSATGDPIDDAFGEIPEKAVIERRDDLERLLKNVQAFLDDVEKGRSG